MFELLCSDSAHIAEDTHCQEELCQRDEHLVRLVRRRLARRCAVTGAHCASSGGGGVHMQARQSAGSPQ